MLKITEGLVLRSFSFCIAELGFFHFLEIVTGRLVPSASEDPSTAWLVSSSTKDPACGIQVSSGR